MKPISWPARLRRAGLVLVGLVLGFAACNLSAQTVADPVVSPASGAQVPVTVSISDATPFAVIRYTLDGSVPTPASPVYYTNLVFTNLTMIRAKAFLTGYSDSGTVYAYYVEPAARTDVGYYRSVTNDAGNTIPLISVTIAGASNVTCFTIEEKLPSMVTPVSITGDGQWLPDLGVIRWGPYTNIPTVTVSYRITGLPGTYSVGGVSWADGRWQFVPPDSDATILGSVDTSVPVPPSQAAAPVIAPLALQAEAASFGTGATKLTNYAGYNGTGYVSFTNNRGYLEFDNVNGGEGGAATLSIRYALGGSTLSGRLIVNGVTNSITFSSTSSWTNWTLLTQGITLNPGAWNTIRFEPQGSGMPNVDEITVAPVSSAVPASFVVTCATPGATIYYTLDGTLPTVSSMAYTGAIQLTNAGVIRARAFLTNWLPSIATVLNAGPTPTTGLASLTRSIATDVAWLPVMTISFTPGSNTTCQAYEEIVPPDLIVTNVSGDGVWGNGVIRWGPYAGTNTQTFSYAALGAAGNYQISGRWSHDGTGTDMGNSTLTIGPTTNTITIPSQPNKLPVPALAISSSATLPVSLLISNAIAGARIYYTTDGTLPTTNSSLYSGALSFTNMTTLRVRSFLDGWLPSDASLGYYGALTNDAGSSLDVVRSIPATTNTVAQITLTATPHGNLQCYTVIETVPLGLAPSNIGQEGVWTQADQTLRWGPFTNQSVVMTYQVSGMGAGYTFAGQASADGYSWPVTGDSNMVLTSSVDSSVPVQPSKLPTPQLTPANSNALPVTVTASCSVATAELRYTLDGTLPTTNSTKYLGALQFTGNTTLRVRAFQAAWIPSDAVVGYYEPAASSTGLIVTRTITNNPGYAPLVRLAVQPVGGVSAYTITESVPYGLTPFNISDGGIWNAYAQTVKWGPFSNETRSIVYQVSGLDGTNQLSGSGSVDGFPVVVSGDTNVVIDSTLMPASAAPAITVQPLSQPQAVGVDLVLYVNAVGSPAPSFQWRKDGTNITGATSQAFVKPAFVLSDAGRYDVLVSNSVGVVTSQVAVVTAMSAPTIQRQPQNQTVRIGETAVFTVEAVSVPDPSYQWRFNGQPLAGRILPTLVLANVTAEMRGNYDVVVSNEVNAVSSQPATLTVRQDLLSLTNGIRVVGGQVQFDIQVIPGRQYWLQYTDDLSNPVWQDLPSATGTNGVLTLTDIQGNTRQRFYRLVEK